MYFMHAVSGHLSYRSGQVYAEAASRTGSIRQFNKKRFYDSVYFQRGCSATFIPELSQEE
jgi:hypothetical protein